mgnify:CR=1 FL=1
MSKLENIVGEDRLVAQRKEESMSMEAMYISFVRKIHQHHGEDGFFYFVEKFKEGGGTARDFNFDGKNYKAFKYALCNVIQKYGRI